jgi:hypothetical protein
MSVLDALFDHTQQISLNLRHLRSNAFAGAMRRQRKMLLDTASPHVGAGLPDATPNAIVKPIHAKAMRGA